MGPSLSQRFFIFSCFFTLILHFYFNLRQFSHFMGNIKQTEKFSDVLWNEDARKEELVVKLTLDAVKCLFNYVDFMAFINTWNLSELLQQQQQQKQNCRHHRLRLCCRRRRRFWWWWLNSIFFKAVSLMWSISKISQQRYFASISWS